MVFLYIIILVVSVYLYLRYIFSYWSRHGFSQLDPSIPIGNLGLVAKGKLSFGVNIYELYKQSTKQFVGIYMLCKPSLLIRDAALVQRMLVTDFASFHDRGFYWNPKSDPMSDHLFAMTGNRWKTMRAMFTPTFSSGKLKGMLPSIVAEGDRVMQFLGKIADINGEVEVRDLMSRYTLNVIGSVIFGLDVDTIADPKHSFRMIEKRFFAPSFINSIRIASLFLCPKLLTILRIRSIPPDVDEYMTNIVKSQIEFREKNNFFRKDFIQILIQMRNTSEIKDDSDVSWCVESTFTNEFKSLTIEQCAAQVLLFYAAGFDSSSTTLSFGLYELARNPEVQRRVQEDIDGTLQKYDGILTYESIMNMKYVESVVKEIVRKYPALVILNRECTKDYPIPETNVIVEKGTSVIFSVLGLMRDPEYFPDPEAFRPERFLEAEPTYNADAYIPFGDGPRSCIGRQLGKMIVQIGIIKLLQKYNLELVDERPKEFDTYNVTLQFKGGIELRFSHRKLM